jgi:hypothetical protein
MKPTIQEVAQELAEGLADAGKIIEGGFAGFRMMVIPSEAPPIQVHEMRMAFFAGAQHLFASIMAVMDTDREPTPRDLHRMSMIHEELEAFRKDFELNHLPTDGSA